MNDSTVSAIFAGLCIAISAGCMILGSFQGLVFWGILAVVIGTFAKKK